MEIDLNADLGEGCGDDEAILDCVSSANIACGWHAGDADTMRAAVQAAKARGVAVGAHPGFPDREHFGRQAMQLPTSTVYSGVLYQIGALQAIARGEGVHLTHVKPHGALYNQAARDPQLAAAIVAAVRAADPDLAVVGLAGGELVRQAHAAGLRALNEVFADRSYLADGSLAPRGTPGALIEDEAQALAQTLQMVTQGSVTAIDGSTVKLHADTVCLHGDAPHAVAFARLLRRELLVRGLSLRAPG